MAKKQKLFSLELETIDFFRDEAYKRDISQSAVLEELVKNHERICEALELEAKKDTRQLGLLNDQ